MKKTLLFMVAGIMIFSLAACDKSNNDAEDVNEPDVVIDEPTDEEEIAEPEVQENEGLVYGAE
jgi:uncharacterized lipoprotein YehR (DUF1307 family)